MGHALLLVWAVVAYVIYRSIRNYATNRYYDREAVRRGVVRAPLQRNRWPFGIDQIRQAQAADRARRFPFYIVDRYALNGNRTHEYSLVGMRGIMTADARNVQALLATQFKDFSLGSYRVGVLGPLLGDGIFVSDGPQWERARHMMRPQFARDQVQDLELEEQHVGRLMRALPVDAAAAGGWTPAVDLQVLFFRLTLDSACQFLFGESVDSQLLGLPAAAGGATSLKVAPDLDADVFARAFDEAQFFCARRARLQDLCYLMDSPAFRREIRRVHKFIDYFVESALRQWRAGKITRDMGGVDPATGRYVFLRALVLETQDPVQLRHQLVNVLLAGRDTTAGMLGWAFYTLARRPDIWQRLRAAILADFGPYGGGGELSFAKLKGCTYLHHFLNETLRLYPVVPLNSRRSVRATTLPSGGGPDGRQPIFVPPHTNVDYSVHVMHRLKAYWGDDAEVFNPDRWHGRRPGWEYLPFNGGPRICLGQQFALTEGAYVIVRLLQRFDAIENLDFTPETHRWTATSSPGNGVKVKLHAAPK